MPGRAFLSQLGTHIPANEVHWTAVANKGCGKRLAKIGHGGDRTSAREQYANVEDAKMASHPKPSEVCAV